jgi:hypothetical protein
MSVQPTELECAEQVASLAKTRAALGEAAFDRAWAEGQAAELNMVVEDAQREVQDV